MDLLRLSRKHSLLGLPLFPSSLSSRKGPVVDPVLENVPGSVVGSQASAAFDELLGPMLRGRYLRVTLFW